MVFRSVGTKGCQAIVLQGESNVELWDWSFRNILLTEDQTGLLVAILMNEEEKLTKLFKVEKDDKIWQMGNQKCVTLLQSTLSVQALYMVMNMDNACEMRNRLCLRYSVDQKYHRIHLLQSLFQVCQSENQDGQSYLAEIDKRLAICKSNKVYPDLRQRIGHLIKGLACRFDEYQTKLYERAEESLEKLDQKTITSEEAYESVVQDICSLDQFYRFTKQPFEEAIGKEKPIANNTKTNQIDLWLKDLIQSLHNNGNTKADLQKETSTDPIKSSGVDKEVESRPILVEADAQTHEDDSGFAEAYRTETLEEKDKMAKVSLIALPVDPPHHILDLFMASKTSLDFLDQEFRMGGTSEEKRKDLRNNLFWSTVSDRTINNQHDQFWSNVSETNEETIKKEANVSETNKETIKKEANGSVQLSDNRKSEIVLPLIIDPLTSSICFQSVSKLIDQNTVEHESTGDKQECIYNPPREEVFPEVEVSTEQVRGKSGASQPVEDPIGNISISSKNENFITPDSSFSSGIVPLDEHLVKIESRDKSEEGKDNTKKDIVLQKDDQTVNRAKELEPLQIPMTRKVATEAEMIKKEDVQETIQA